MPRKSSLWQVAEATRLPCIADKLHEAAQPQERAGHLPVVRGRLYRDARCCSKRARLEAQPVVGGSAEEGNARRLMDGFMVDAFQSFLRLRRKLKS